MADRFGEERKKMTAVKYELRDGTVVSTLCEALESGLDFKKMYVETYPWGEERRKYESDNWNYARRRAEFD